MVIAAAAGRDAQRAVKRTSNMAAIAGRPFRVIAGFTTSSSLNHSQAGFGPYRSVQASRILMRGQPSQLARQPVIQPVARLELLHVLGVENAILIQVDASGDARRQLTRRNRRAPVRTG